MEYEKMFILLTVFMFTFTLLINFFGLTMADSMDGLLPESMTFMSYSKETMETDMGLMTDETGVSADSSGETSGDNTLNIGQFGAAWSTFNKLIVNVFFGYYEIGDYFGNKIDDGTGGVLALFQGIGLIFSIAMIFGLLLMIRSVVFRV